MIALLLLLIPANNFVIEIPRPEPIMAVVTAYTNLPELTDSTPDIVASGKKVYDGAIANNCRSFGTKIKLLGKEYTVEDRMNRRYGCSHWDIFVSSYDEAIKFGRIKTEVYVMR